MNNSTRDEQLTYRVFGNGYPVVFLHGFLESKSMWEVLPPIQGIKAICIDLPGHGESTHFLDATHSMQQMATKVYNLVCTLKIADYALVGHSMGGYVGIELMKMDKNCDRILLLNSNFWTDSTSKKIDRKRVADMVQKNKRLFLYESIPNLFFDPQSHDLQVKQLIKEAILMSPEAISASSIAMSKRIDNTKWLEENQESVVIVQGAEDRIISEVLMRERLGKIACSYYSLKNVGHMAHIEDLGEVIKIVGEFIRCKSV